MLFIWPFGGLFGLLAAAVVVLLLINMFKKSSRVNEKTINKDLKAFRAELEKKSDTLIPWKQEDLALLSLNLAEFSKSRGKNSVERGVLKNIYQEDTLAYIIKHYDVKDAKTLLIARGHDFEMVWVRNKDGITVYRNQQQVGSILRDGRFFTPTGKQLLGQIQSSDNLDLSVFLDGKLKALIKREQNEDAVNPRALEVFGELHENDQMKILAMSMFDVVKSARKV